MSGCAWEGFFSSHMLKRWYGAIAQRFSCRWFVGEADIQQKSALAYVAGRTELPGVRIAFANCEGKHPFAPVPLWPGIEGAQQYAAVIEDEAIENVRLHSGIAGEALCLEASLLGLGSCWIGGSFRRSQVDIPLKPGERIAALIPFGVPQDPEGASERRRKPLSALCLDDAAAWPLWAYEAAEAVRAAPSRLNAQPWRMSFSGSTFMLSGRGFGSIDYGIAILHIACALQGMKPHYRFSGDEKALLIKIEETHDAV